MAMEACGEKEQLKLLGVSFSYFVLRVCITLALKGINDNFVEENMQNKSHFLLQLNPCSQKDSKFPTIIT